MRKFLVVLDDSRECLNAMRFAAMRAAHTGGGVEVLSVIPPDEFNHWIGVGDIMREEARERIEAHFEVFAKWMRDKQGVNPGLVIREGEPVTEILAQVRDDPCSGPPATRKGRVRWSPNSPEAPAGCRSRSPSCRAISARSGSRRSPERWCARTTRFDA
jgi:hypothetical protein